MNKNLGFILIILMIPLFLNGQDPFIPVNWLNYPTDNSYDENPFNKKDFYCFAAPEDFVFEDLNTENEFDLIWESLQETGYVENHIIGPNDPYDLDVDATFGCAFKTMYDNQYLYVLIKLTDVNGIMDELSNRFEIMTQASPLIDMQTGRYEYDFQQAATIFDQNRSYTRYIELGGLKTSMNNDGSIQDMSASLGTSGSWDNVIGYLDESLNWNVSNKEFKYVLALPFEDYPLAYPTDPYGDITNLTSFYPEPGDTIVFDMTSDFEINSERYHYAWSSQEIQIYGSNYQAGRLIFETPKPEVPQNNYSYCVNESAPQLQATGENLKWYTTPGGTYTTTAPTPPSTTPGTQKYYVTQTIRSYESEPAEITVNVYTYEATVADQEILCGQDVHFEVHTNYIGSGSESFSWVSEDFGTFSETQIEFNPNGSTTFDLTATTSSGCNAVTSASLVVGPSNRTLKLATVSVLPEDDQNEISWEAGDWPEIDSLFLWSRTFGSNEEYTPIYETGFQPGQNSYTDLRQPSLQKGSEYTVRLKDKCSFITAPEAVLPDHHPVKLTGAAMEGQGIILQWTTYDGRSFERYEVLRGTTNQPSEIIFSATNDQSYYDLSLPNENTYYRIRTVFANNYPEQELNESYSNAIQIGAYENIYTDTVEVFDTTFIFINDTIDVYDTTYVTINDTIDILDTTYISVSVTDTLFIDAVITSGAMKLTNTLKVYPNPARDHLFIHTGDYRMNGYILKIINESGAVVHESNLEQQLYELNLNNWSGKGLYLLQLLNSEGDVIEVKKIILR